MTERNEPRTKYIDVRTIIVDPGICQRADRGDDNVLRAYRFQIEDGWSLPPLIIFENQEGMRWLARGFHQLEGMKLAGVVSAYVVIYCGSRRDAILFACGVDDEHPWKGRSNQDKRMAVRTMLLDNEWCQWSDAEIARQCKVSEGLVRRLRAMGSNISLKDPRLTREKYVCNCKYCAGS